MRIHRILWAVFASLVSPLLATEGRAADSLAPV